MELKPCPFCGGDQIGVVETAYGNYMNIFYFAHCDNCGCRTKLFREGDDAEEAWNRRVNDG